jgi:hypothetical protein
MRVMPVAVDVWALGDDGRDIRTMSDHFLGPPLAGMHLAIDTILPADSVEFCPHPDASNILVCGTYKLEDQQDVQDHPHLLDSVSPTSVPTCQVRRGQCIVFEIDSEQDIRVCALPAFIYNAQANGISALRFRRYPFQQSWTSNGKSIPL